MKANVLPHSVFVHTPKTGGTWIREHFNEMGWWEQLGEDHMSGREASQLYPDKFRFCFVRHPVDLLESCWRFVFARMRASEPAIALRFASYVGRDVLDPEKMLSRYWAVDVNVFAAAMLSDRPSLPTEFFAHWIEACHFVGKTENLAADLVTALRSAGEDFPSEVILGWQDRRNIAADCLDSSISPKLAAAIVESNREFCDRYGYTVEGRQSQ